MGKEGQPGTYFNGKYICKKLFLYFNRKLQVKMEVGVSSFVDIIISNDILHHTVKVLSEILHYAVPDHSLWLLQYYGSLAW